MTSPADIDALIAALHPHVSQYLFDDGLYADVSLQPAKKRTLSLSLLDSFAVLLGHHPGSNSVAVTAQTHQPGRTSLYICSSPSIPDGLHGNVKEWMALFSAMCIEYAEGVPHDDTFSGSEMGKRFVLYTHRLCYPAMHRRVLKSGLSEWEVLIALPEPMLEPTEEERRLREKLADDLRHLSELAQTFVHAVSRETLGDDGDVLLFYALCVTIRDVVTSTALETFFRKYIYIFGFDGILQHLRLPIAVSTLLALSRNPKLAFDNQCSVIVVDPSLESRPFSATVTDTHLAASFGKVLGVGWKSVVQAFDVSTAPTWAEGLYGKGLGLEWNEQERLLSSSPGCPAIIHPEVMLIHHVLENSLTGSGGEAKGYIACSEVPCYASVRYAGAMNKALQTGFTMRTDHPDWCKLDSVAPWVLPETTPQEVVDALREELLQDLDYLINEWLQL
ncbi:hypothetical protein V8D89_001374 [Ganoderma adspersum]